MKEEVDAPNIMVRKTYRVYVERRRDKSGYCYNAARIDLTEYFMCEEHVEEGLGMRVLLLKKDEKYAAACIQADECALVTDLMGRTRYLEGGFLAIQIGGRTAITDCSRWEAGRPIPLIGLYEDVDTKYGNGWIVLDSQGKKNAVIPHVSRDLFFTEWQDEIKTMLGFAKVRRAAESAALDKDGRVLATDVVSVSAYGDMCFIKCKGKKDSIVVNSESKVIAQSVLTFTSFGNYSAIMTCAGGYWVIDRCGNKVFDCRFEKVTRLGVGRVGLMYKGLWYIFDDNMKRISNYGFAAVGKYISDFSNNDSKDGYLLVSMQGKFNYVTECGTLLLPFWAEKAEPFSFPKTASITYRGKEYLVYDSKNMEGAWGVMRTTRPAMRVCGKSRRLHEKIEPVILLDHSVSYDNASKSFVRGGAKLRGITARVRAATGGLAAVGPRREYGCMPAAEYGRMLHGLIETIEKDGTRCFEWKSRLPCNGIDGDVAAALHMKYMELRNLFEAVFVESEYACWNGAENATSVDFVFADVDGGAILVEIKTNAAFPAEYLRAQMSIEKDFFLKTNPQISRARTFCFWFPRGRVNDAEIREVNADLTCDEMDTILRINSMAAL